MNMIKKQEKPAKIEDPKRPELMMNDYPKYIVDFSKLFHANMNKELEFEKQELDMCEWSRLISPQITPYVKEKAYFPLYCTSELKFNYEETQPGNHSSPSQNILIGLLKVSCRDGQIIAIDLLYNVWNFLEFNSIYDEAILKKSLYPSSQQTSSSSNLLSSGNGGYSNSLPQAVEQELVMKMERFCLKTPFYYWPTIRKIFVDKGLQFLADHKYAYLYGEVLQEQEEFVRNFLKFKQKERKKLDEDTKQNRFNHSIKKSACCAPNSENYEFINRQMHPKSTQRVQLENLLCAKEEILFRKAPKIIDSSLSAAQQGNKSLQLLSQQNQYSGQDQILNNNVSSMNNNNNQISLSFSNPKLDRKYIKDDQIKRIHFKSEPVSKMSELLRNVKQQEYRDATVDEDEIKCVKEPMPFGNPFKIIARIKNSRSLNQQNELISSEENYINTNIHQGNKLSQNLLTNRLPKLKKLKQSVNASLSSSVVSTQVGDGDNSESDSRIEGEIRKKIKVSDNIASSSIESDSKSISNNNSSNNNSNKSKVELTSVNCGNEVDQIYIVEKISSDDGSYQQNDTDQMMYDPQLSNQLPFDNTQPYLDEQDESELEEHDGMYEPEIHAFGFEAKIPQKIEQQQYQGSKQNPSQKQNNAPQQNQTEIEEEEEQAEEEEQEEIEVEQEEDEDDDADKEEDEEEEQQYNPERSNIDSKYQTNEDGEQYGYDDNYNKYYDSQSVAQNQIQTQSSSSSSSGIQQKQTQNKSTTNQQQQQQEDIEQKNQVYETNKQKSESINQFYVSESNQNDYENESNSYKPSLIIRKQNSKQQQQQNYDEDGQQQQQQQQEYNLEQGYNPDSEADNNDDLQEEEIQTSKPEKTQQIVVENKIKKFVYNKYVYDLKQKYEQMKLTNEQLQQQKDDEEKEEYNPNAINKSNNNDDNYNDNCNDLVKIEFSTKYLLSPQKKSNDFLVKYKDFFDNLLIIHRMYTRDDLKPYVGKQLKEITDQKLKDVFKQRVAEIVYIDKNLDSVQQFMSQCKSKNQAQQNK